MSSRHFQTIVARSIATIVAVLMLLAPTSSLRAEQQSTNERDIGLVDELRASQPWLEPSNFGPLPDYEISLPLDAVENVAAAQDVSVDLAKENLDRQNAYYVIASLAEKVLGDRVTGSWLDQEAGVMNVYTSGDAKIAQERLSSIAAADSQQLSRYADAIRVHEVGRSRSELSAASEAANLLYEQLTAVSGPVTISSNVRTGEVDVVVSRSIDDARALLEPLEGAVTVTQDDSAASVQETACTRNQCLEDRVARGGMGVNGCTIGFVARSVTGDSRYLLSANHCWTNASPGNQVFHDGSYVGYQSGGDDCCLADAGRIRVSGSGWTTANWLYHDLSVQRLQMEARISSGWCKANCGGTAIFNGGRTSGLRPGTISNPSITVGGRTGSYISTPTQCGGDSGGPSYTYPQAWAIGVNWAGVGARDRDIGGQPCFADTGASHILDAEAVADVTVLTN